MMSTISYFFELYDDDHDGKVDREGILRISEALLFLSRKGFESPLLATNSTLYERTSDGAGEADTQEGGGKSEQFLSSVSAFIRRCFEYADPDRPSTVDPKANEVAAAKENGTPNGQEDFNAFSIGDDDDEDELDLLDVRDDSKQTKNTSAPGIASHHPISPKPSINKANAALDPSNPLHITLPTFRMVILADETLESFFDSSFPYSFHLSATPAAPASSTIQPSSSSSISSPTRTNNLTTFSNIRHPSSTNLPAPRSAGGALPAAAGSKGLRGMLDTIVTDGMRVAAEVRRRYDEAQRAEMERNRHRPTEEEEDDEDPEAPARASTPDAAERRSVRESDNELLEGADAAAALLDDAREKPQASGPIAPDRQPTSLEPAGEKLVEFER